MKNLQSFTEFLNESNRTKRDNGKIYFHELSDIDHTRLIKWMGNNLKARIEDYDFVKGGKSKFDAYTLETSKMSERDLKDLLNYIDKEGYKFSTTIWLPAYIKEEITESKINEAINNFNVSDFPIGAVVHMDDEEWKVVKPGAKGNKIFMAPFNRVARDRYISVAIEYDLNWLNGAVTKIDK